MNKTDVLLSPERQKLLYLLEGYRPAKTLMVAVEVGVFDGLAAGPATLEDLASRLELPTRSLGILLRACRSIGILEKNGDLYSNSPQADAYLVAGKPGYLGNAAKLESMFFWQWGTLEETVRSGKPLQWESKGGESDEWGGDDEWDQGAWSEKFIWAMHDRAVGKAELLAEILDLKGKKQLYDVGGGSGAFSVALVRKNPGLRATVFDVPTTIPITKKVVDASGLSESITLQAGNYHEDEFGEPESNDVVLFSGVLNSEGEESCLRLLGKAHKSLKPGGLLVVRDYMLNDAGVKQVEALFSLHMLLVTDYGQTHNEEEMLEWVARAGFMNPEVKYPPEPDESTLVLARK